LSRTFRYLSIAIVVLLVISSFGGLLWANVVLVQQQPVERSFFVPWMGMRNYLNYGYNPYEKSSTESVQLAYYKRFIREGEDPLYLTVPFYIELIYFPFAFVNDYTIARALWMVLVEIACIIFAFQCLRFTDWKPDRVLKIIFILTSLFWLPALYSLLGDGTSLFAVAIFTLSLVLLQAEKDELAGSIMVFTLIRPQVVIIPILYILYWTISHDRLRVFWLFLATMIFLVSISFLILPDWFLPFARNLYAVYQTNDGITPLRILRDWWPSFGEKLGWIITGGSIILLIFEWNRSHRPVEFRHFIWTICLTIILTPVMGIPISISDLVLLFISFTFILYTIEKRWVGKRKSHLSDILFILSFLVSWIFIAYLLSISAAKTLIEISILLVPTLMLIALYWFRRFVIHPPVTWLETIRE
jgi:hypothetical protein